MTDTPTIGGTTVPFTATGPAASHPLTAANVRKGEIKRDLAALRAEFQRRVVPLCPRHHQIQHGPRESVEALSHRGFFAEYGVDLLALADRLWAETEALCTA